MSNCNKIKVLYLIPSLYARGAQRQFLELLSYLNEKNEYEIKVVFTRNIIQYKKFFDLQVPYEVIERKYIKKDPRLFYLFYQTCKKYKPDIIHAWSGMEAFYVLPAVIFLKIPMINYQIQTAPLKYNRWSFSAIINYFNFKFSKVIVSNSFAGLRAFRVNSQDAEVVYNGVDVSRFNLLPNKNKVKEKYGIKTKYAVIMVASFSKDKKYHLFVEVANQVAELRNDVTFIGVGENLRDNREFLKTKKVAEINNRLLFPGRISDVEALANACDIGVLFTYSEGISNAIIEYMALGKPVIANDGGGTNEIVKNDINGYLINEDNPEEISNLIIDLLDNEEKRIQMGKEGRALIHNLFTIEKMGQKFEEIYKNIITARTPQPKQDSKQRNIGGES